MKVLAATSVRRQPLAWRRFKDYDARAERLPRLWWEFIWEPRDLWVGVYWTRPDVKWRHAVDIYLCAVPCLPLKLRLRWAGSQRTPWVDALEGQR